MKIEFDDTTQDRPSCWTTFGELEPWEFFIFGHVGKDVLMSRENIVVHVKINHDSYKSSCSTFVHSYISIPSEPVTRINAKLVVSWIPGNEGNEQCQE